MTNSDVINKLFPIYREIELLSEDAAAILDEAKEAGLNKSFLAKIAKAKASEKLQDLYEKTSELSDLLDEVK